MKLQLVPPPLIDDVWPHVQGWLSRAIDKGDRWWSEERLRAALTINEGAALFLAIDQKGVHAACAVMVEDKPNGERVMHVPACGGVAVRSWVHLFDEIEEWGRSQGVDQVEIGGRRGWKRLFEERGYRERPVVTMEKNL